MTKAVFTTKVTPSYRDLPGDALSLPTDLPQSSARGRGRLRRLLRASQIKFRALKPWWPRQAYFGVARVETVIEDTALADHYFAIIDPTSYLDFDRAVSFQEYDTYYESALQKDDGSTNKKVPSDGPCASYPGRRVRANLQGQVSLQFIVRRCESSGTFHRLVYTSRRFPSERPIVEMMVSRPFRERSFMHNVRAAYSNRCAITGLRLINGGGRPEVQAAHIQPVASKGPDLNSKWIGVIGNCALDV